ncbi:MAG TPA: hypothetical protein VGC65_06105 [Bacteroidia bacterium]|jgi:hypothetical protein
MKKIKLISAWVVCTVFLLSTTSCFVAVHEGGGKRGWHKNSNNPHHPNSTNPGHSKGKGKGKK